MGTPRNRSVPTQRGCRVCDTYNSRKSGVKSLVLHLPLDSFQERGARAIRSADWFLRNVNAILNSSSHTCLCIHAENLRFFDSFCQIVDERLVSLIPDDTLFHHNFHSWFYDKKHLVFRFKDRSRDRGWSTLDFNSTVSLNRGRQERLLHTQFRNFMEEVVRPSGQIRTEHDRNDESEFFLNKEVKFLEDIPFQECAYHQAKDKACFRSGRGLSGNKLANILWRDCKLSTYISAFSKVHGGGSVYFGIEEKYVERGAKEFRCKGVKLTLSKFEDLKRELNQKLVHSMTWFGLSSEDSIVPVEMSCSTITDKGVHCDKMFVVKVKVRFFPGVCFHKAGGPTSFTFIGNQNEPSPVSVSEWMTKNNYTDLKKYKAEIDGREVRIRCADGAGAEGVE